MRPIDGDALEQFFLHESMRLRELLDDPELDPEEKEYIRSFAPTIEWARKTVHNVTTLDVVPRTNYRVPSEAEWMERYCNEKQLEEYKKRKEGWNEFL